MRCVAGKVKASHASGGSYLFVHRCGFARMGSQKERGREADVRQCVLRPASVPPMTQWLGPCFAALQVDRLHMKASLTSRASSFLSSTFHHPHFPFLSSSISPPPSPFLRLFHPASPPRILLPPVRSSRSDWGLPWNTTSQAAFSGRTLSFQPLIPITLSCVSGDTYPPRGT